MKLESANFRGSCSVLLLDPLREETNPVSISVWASLPEGRGLPWNPGSL